MMPWIGEKLCAPTCINGVIENIRQHVIEQTCFVTTHTRTITASFMINCV